MIVVDALSDTPIAVLGLGRSGRAAARALIRGRSLVWAWDDDRTARAVAGREGIPLVDLFICDMAQLTTLVLSPGVPHRHPAPHPVVARAAAVGCEIVGDIDLLARAQPDATYVGITGTNGKSTTTALIGHVLAATGRSAQVGGNLGIPALELEPLGEGELYVLEVSSFQLEITPSAVFDVAILLNISPDHLERHGGMEGYVAAKRLIFRRQGGTHTAVVGVDDEYGRRIADDLDKADEGPQVIRISGNRPVSGGVYAANGVLFDDTVANGPAPVIDLDEAPALPGAHNAQNAAAAFAAARALGVDSQAIADAMRTFPGLAHRQERVAEIDGIAFVNDSKATNPEAAARALASYRFVYWIAGGRSKNSSLDPLTPFLDRVRHAYLIGEAQEELASFLKGRVPLTPCETLDRAVPAAAARARQDGLADAVVLLSPACASFDQFENFEERGEAFRDLVAEQVQ